jgi:hypothetical protein
LAISSNAWSLPCQCNLSAILENGRFDFERNSSDRQLLADAEGLIAAWNERQARRMPLLFAPTIGAALTARRHFLWVYCPACRTTRDIDLRTIDRHRDAAVTSLIPLLSCRSCRPHAPFAQMRIEHTRRVLGG